MRCVNWGIKLQPAMFCPALFVMESAISDRFPLSRRSTPHLGAKTEDFKRQTVRAEMWVTFDMKPRLASMNQPQFTWTLWVCLNPDSSFWKSTICCYTTRCQHEFINRTVNKNGLSSCVKMCLKSFAWLIQIWAARSCSFRSGKRGFLCFKSTSKFNTRINNPI